MSASQDNTNRFDPSCWDYAVCLKCGAEGPWNTDEQGKLIPGDYWDRMSCLHERLAGYDPQHEDYRKVRVAINQGG